MEKWRDIGVCAFGWLQYSLISLDKEEEEDSLISMSQQKILKMRPFGFFFLSLMKNKPKTLILVWWVSESWSHYQILLIAVKKAMPKNNNDLDTLLYQHCFQQQVVVVEDSGTFYFILFKFLAIYHAMINLFALFFPRVN